MIARSASIALLLAAHVCGQLVDPRAKPRDFTDRFVLDLAKRPARARADRGPAMRAADSALRWLRAARGNGGGWGDSTDPVVLEATALAALALLGRRAEDSLVRSAANTLRAQCVRVDPTADPTARRRWALIHLALLEARAFRGVETLGHARGFQDGLKTRLATELDKAGVLAARRWTLLTLATARGLCITDVSRPLETHLRRCTALDQPRIGHELAAGILVTRLLERPLLKHRERRLLVDAWRRVQEGPRDGSYDNVPAPDIATLESWWWTSLAKCQLSEKDYLPWFLARAERLLTAQIRNGNNAGSWDPRGEAGIGASRVAQTAWAVLFLTSPWRYEPRLERKPKRGKKK